MRIQTLLQSHSILFVFFISGLLFGAAYQTGNAQLSEADKEALAQKGSLGWSPDLSDPAFYRGLSAEEANRSISFLKALALSAKRIEPNPKAVALFDKVDGFLRVHFKDTIRNHGWTEEEKLLLCLYQLEAESLGVYQFESKAEGKQLGKLWREYKFEYKRKNISWPIMPLKGKTAYVADPEYPGMNEVDVVQMKEMRKDRKFVAQDSLGPDFPQGYGQRLIPNLGDPSVYHGLSDTEKSELVEFLKTIFADTICSSEGEDFKRRLWYFLSSAFADTSRDHSWTVEENSRLSDFRNEAERLKLMEFNTEEKRKRILQQTE